MAKRGGQDSGDGLVDGVGILSEMNVSSLLRTTECEFRACTF